MIFAPIIGGTSGSAPDGYLKIGIDPMYFICSDKLRAVYNLTPTGSDTVLSSNQIINQNSATIADYKTDLINKVTKYSNFETKTSISNKVCRIRFYIPSNYKSKVAELFGENLKDSLEAAKENENNVYLSDEIYNAGDTTGTFVEYTMSAPDILPEFASVFIDPGHVYTSDRISYTDTKNNKVNWNTYPYNYIASKLSLNPNDKRDNLEHALNVRIAQSFKKYLEMKGISAYIFDRPEMGNGAEITAVKSAANKMKCELMVSIHCNGSGPWARSAALKNTATGTIGFYSSRSQYGKAMTEKMVTALTNLREATGGGTNSKGASQRNLSTISGVTMPGVYLEVIFYDNVNELKWLADNIENVGKTLADCVDYSGNNNQNNIS